MAHLEERNSEVCPSLVNGDNCSPVMHFQTALANMVALPTSNARHSLSHLLTFCVQDVRSETGGPGALFPGARFTAPFISETFSLLHTLPVSHILCALGFQQRKVLILDTGGAKLLLRPQPAPTGETEKQGPKLSETYLNISPGRRDPSVEDGGEEANRRAGMTVQCQVTGQHSSAIFTRSFATGSPSEIAK